MYVLDLREMEDETFVRLWLLLYNPGDSAVEFDAARDVNLTVEGNGASYPDLRPRYFGGIDSLVDEAAPDGIFGIESVENTLWTMASQREHFIYGNDLFDLMAGGPWLGAGAAREVAGGVNPTRLLEIYDAGSHELILGHYRIMPLSAVDGFMLFPLPGFQASTRASGTDNGHLFTYRFEFRLPSGTEHVNFTAN